MKQKEILRAEYIKRRNSLLPEEKKKKDSALQQNLLESPQFKQAQVLLIFVSTEKEPDTRAIIEEAFAQEKAVAVPYCIRGTRDMEFYLINSFSQLKKGYFSILEPDTSVCKKLSVKDKSESLLCVVPGLVFDKKGFRIGYGGGYYDRFLAANRMTTAGLAYYEFVVEELAPDGHDMPVEYVITDLNVIKTQKSL